MRWRARGGRSFRPIRRAKRKPRTVVSLRTERLECRAVLDARLVITEVVASNQQGLEDEDNDRSDWIEVYNAGDSPADLEGWHLTDDAEDRQKWSLPKLSLDPNNYLVVFASGKDRRDPGGNLHTNFRLRSEGEYLGLVQPNGSVAFEFAPRFPALPPNRSFGLPQDSVDSAIAESATGVRVFVPTEDNGGSELRKSWTEIEFEDSHWMTGAGGIGFGDVFNELVGMNIQEQLHRVGTSVFLRIPFTLDQPDQFFSAVVRLRYNDGYVAYLNGQEIARANVPSVPDWNSVAASSRASEQAIQFEDLDVSQWVQLLRAGPNVLAIHGLNRSRTSGDFLLEAELHAGRGAKLTHDAPRFFEHTSPGRSNGTISYAGLLPNTDASVQRGFFDAPFDLILNSEMPGATLVYTTDGSSPTLDNGTLVPPSNAATRPSAEIHIAGTTTLRIAAYKADHLGSRVDTQTYIFLGDVRQQDFQHALDAGFPDDWKGAADADYGLDPDVIGPNDLFNGQFATRFDDALLAAPTMSLVTEVGHLFDFDNGIYMNSLQSGPDWERPTSVEFIYPDGSSGFQENAGIRIQGENVRNLVGSRKQSFRLEFREQYGATKLRFPVLGDDAADQFDTLIARGFYNDRWVSRNAQYIRDQWARSTLLDMGQPNSHGIWVHVYLNGLYWGMYNLIERPNASFSSSYFGGAKDEWDTLNSGDVRDGTKDAWRALRDEARKVKVDDPTQSNQAYLRLLGKNAEGVDDPAISHLLDVENYIDYLIVNFYGGNNDWPHKNYYVGRQRGEESTGFKFYSWDAEKILDHGGGSTLHTDSTGVTPGVAEAYASLRTNTEFRLDFADRVHRHFFNGGALYVDPLNPAWDPAHPERNVPAARYDAIAKQVELPIIGESARWGDSNADRPLTFNDWQATRDALNANYFPRRSDVVLEQFVQAGLYPDLAAPVFSQHGGSIETGFQLLIDAPGEVYFTLDGSDPRQSALDPGVTESGVSPNASQYLDPVTLNAGAIVSARTFQHGQWSALNEAVFTVDESPLRIAEIMYHPRDPLTAGDFFGDDFEFVELVNSSDANSISLEGVALTSGIQFVFPSISLRPGERVVVVSNAQAFRERYGDGFKIAGEYGDNFKLSNGGESLRLEDRFGQVIHEFAYDDAWFSSTDGDGYSLTIIDHARSPESWNTAEAWRASAAIDGSPGAEHNPDFNGDRKIDVADVDVYCAAHRAHDLRFDFTRDEAVDHRDLVFLIDELLGSTIGDANLDGSFDLDDLMQTIESGEFEDGRPDNSSWSEGDWNCNGDFGTEDLVAAFTNGDYRAAARAARIVPRASVAAAIQSFDGPAEPRPCASSKPRARRPFEDENRTGARNRILELGIVGCN